MRPWSGRETPTSEGRRRLPALIRFAELHVASEDIDPMYPVLRHLQRRMDREDALWHSLLYVAFYNVASSQQAYGRYPSPAQVEGDLARLPTGTERRNLRGGGPLTRHTGVLAELASAHGGAYAWLTHQLVGDPRADWTNVQGTIRQAWGNGRWAAYKTAEVLMKVNGFRLEATDMGNAFSTGPRRGLELFFGRVDGNSYWPVAKLDAQGEVLRELLRDHGIELGIEQLETVLCDFHSMHEGRYYVGNDIDLMQGQLEAAELAGADLTAVWLARAAALPNRYLGELRGWSGVDKARATRYLVSGEVVGR